MARSGPQGPAPDSPRQSGLIRSVPNQAGLERLGSMVDGQAGSGPASGSPASTFDESGLMALGDQIKRGRSHARPGGGGTRRGRTARKATKAQRRFRKTKRALLAVALVLVVLVGGTAAYAYHLNHQIHHIDVKGLINTPSTGADAGTQNILMVGSTTRCGLAVQNAAYGLCSQGVTGVNSDVVMILHLDPNKHKVSILSIPRDLFVPNARSATRQFTAANKIDAGLYQGPSQLVAAINEDFGIPIQHYVVLNFDTFANVVNDLGGVHMYFPEPVFDAYSGLNQQTTGCIALNGTRALQVVRARHLQYKGPGVTATNPHYWPYEHQSDLGRIRRDHEFLRVLATAVAKNGLSNPITDTQLVGNVAPQLQVDSSFSLSDMVSLILAFHGVNANSAPQSTLPVEVAQFGSYTYKGIPGYGAIEFPSIVQDHQTIDSFLGISSTTDTMHGGPLPSPSSVTVSVENGTGVYNQAADTAASLHALGFQTVGIGDVPSIGAQSETIVYYAKMTPADEAAAQAVADSMSGAVIEALGPSHVTDGAQVTVDTGTQFAVDTPAAPSTSTSSAAASSSSTNSAAASSSSTNSAAASSSSTNSAFAAPSPATSPLRPWDPRACTASGGEGP